MTRLTPADHGNLQGFSDAHEIFVPHGAAFSRESVASELNDILECERDDIVWLTANIRACEIPLDYCQTLADSYYAMVTEIHVNEDVAMNAEEEWRNDALAVFLMYGDHPWSTPESVTFAVTTHYVKYQTLQVQPFQLYEEVGKISQDYIERVLDEQLPDDINDDYIAGNTEVFNVDGDRIYYDGEE